MVDSKSYNKGKLDANLKRDLVQEISPALIERYIYEDIAQKMAELLRKNQKNKKYDTIIFGAELAKTLTDDLRSISNDLHLKILYKDKSPNKKPAPINDDVPNDGFPKVEILKGNIGYLDLRAFWDSDAAFAKADAAMVLLGDVDALIIDLGRNGGGGEPMVRHISTYLFDEPVHLASTFMRGWDSPKERWTYNEVSGKRLSNIPVYILTSRQTFSAAESFTFGLRLQNRITIVGDRTGGGGHWGGIHSLSDGFSIWLPRGRTYDPKTGKGWEAEGIEPDVKVSYEEAFKVAYKDLLRKVGS